MTLSIITVSHNARPTIEKTLRSVLEQESAWEVEYIVVDGGSTDGTVDVLRQYDEHLDWQSGPDEGIYDAMNKGIRRATGEWIGILNADDWYARDAFQTLFSAVQEEPADGVVVGGVIRVTEDGEMRKYVTPPNEEFTTLRPNNHPATFVHRSVYERDGGYRLAYPIAADLDFIMRAEETETPIRRVDAPLTYMREGGASSGFEGVLESAAVERAHGHPVRAVRVLLRKLWQKGRRRMLQSILPPAAMRTFRKQWWDVRRDQYRLTDEDHWVSSS